MSRRIVLSVAAIALVVHSTAAQTSGQSGSATASTQSSAATAKKSAPKLPVVAFTHDGCGPERSECRLAYSLDLADGAKFQVDIDRTKLSEFTYNIAGVLAAKPSEAKAEKAEWDDTSFVQTHDKKFGGYVVTIRRKAESRSPLPDATLIISVRTIEWQLGFAGGFPVSTIVDRVFSLRDTTVGSDKKYLVEQERRSRDRVALSTATFIHARKNTWPLAASFGLGIGGATAYYFGPSLLLGDVGAFTAGVAFGSRKDLPAGVKVNTVTSNANALATLPARNTTGAFIAFSYTFLGGDKTPFEKPFKGADPTTSGAAAGAAAAGNKPATETSSLSVIPGQGPKDTPLTFTLKLVRSSGTFTSEDTDITVHLSEVSAQVTGVPESVKLKLSTDKRSAEGTFTGKIKPDAAASAAPIKLTADAQGVSSKLETKPFTVTPQ